MEPSCLLLGLEIAEDIPAHRLAACQYKHWFMDQISIKTPDPKCSVDKLASWMKSSLVVVEVTHTYIDTPVHLYMNRWYRILRHSGIWGAEDEAVLNIVHYKKKPKNTPSLKKSGSFCLFPFVFALRFVLGQAIFRFIFVSLRFFRFFSRLLHVRFRFRFLLFRFDVKQAKSCFLSLPSETKFSLQFQFSLSKRKRGRTL